MTTRVYLIRHAQAEGNIQRRFQGHTDAGLTPAGEKQLEYLKKRCAEFRFDAAYSSPLTRAKQTALAAIGDRDLELRIEPRLIEMNIGELENVPYAELTVRFAEDFRLWTNEPHRFAAPGGETMKQVYDRTYAAITDIVRANEGKNVLVVSHGCAMRAMLPPDRCRNSTTMRTSTAFPAPRTDSGSRPRSGWNAWERWTTPASRKYFGWPPKASGSVPRILCWRSATWGS